MTKYIFTSESVSAGHPDKICDRISDAVLDLCLSIDPYAKVACETLATTNHVTLAGEIRGNGITDNDGKILPEIKEKIIQEVRNSIKDIGYEQDNFHWNTVDVNFLLHSQSADIAQGVELNQGLHKEEGAGDQGIMFGYATNETETLMPPAIYYSHEILKKLTELRKSDKNPGFLPDMKSQVSLVFENGIAVGVDSIVVSSQHEEKLSNDEIKKHITKIIEDVIPSKWPLNYDKIFINPTGKFVIGGPDGDCGLTGRKIIVDTYGGAAPHGGGAFSGKDPSKVDRSAAYVARYIAKNIVAAKIAEKCLIQLSYAIGVAKPTSIFVDTYGTSKYSNEQIVDAIEKSIDLTPSGIREHLKLANPIYVKTSSFGHFGREEFENGHFTWEKTDLVDSLKKNI